jgi:NADH-quinone oxidoreductase subunit L
VPVASGNEDTNKKYWSGSMEIALVTAPFLGSLLAFLCQPLLGSRGGPLASVLLSLAGAAVAVFLAWDCLNGDSHTVMLIDWFSSSDLQVAWSVMIDRTSSIMLVVITVVSALVHLYSLDYMRDDPRRDVFFGNISLFTGCMIMLVTADNLLQLYFGWEGVGLCSYLLINHWYERNSANKAAIKSFIVNRVGDFAFCLGLLAIFVSFGSLQYDQIFAHTTDIARIQLDVSGVHIHALTVICLLLFVGAMAKSAQIGLHVWLPDAMEAPTPVSALIHAATMVTAGVFMLVRLAPLFQAAPTSLAIVTLVGGLTAFMAATIAVTQNDIKRIIAYSTMSQLGFMVAACGASATDAAMFHLFTHAFFKAVLFLGAGMVIHTLAGEQDIRRMGGLVRTLPFTALAMAIGSLALAGIPGFSGFLSKEAILTAVYASGHPSGAAAFLLLVATVPLTAFYSWRLMFTVFFGPPAVGPQAPDHGHDHGRGHDHGHGGVVLMATAVAVLTGATLVSGKAVELVRPVGEMPGPLMVLITALALAGMAVAWVVCVAAPDLQHRAARSVASLNAFLNNKWGFDSVYDHYLVTGVRRASRRLVLSVKMSGIENIIARKIVTLTLKFSRACVRAQTGLIYDYALTMIIGMTALATVSLMSMMK